MRIGSYEKSVPQLSAAVSVGAAAVDDSPGKNPWIWKTDSYLGLLFILIGAAFMWESFDYRPVARNFPLALGALIIVLSVVQLIKSGWERGESTVLDLGMLSNEVEGQRRSAVILSGYFVAFVVLAYVIGLQYAAILFAATVPAAFMIGRRPWAWGFLTGGILVLLVFGLFDNLINIIWPDSLLSIFLDRE